MQIPIAKKSHYKEQKLLGSLPYLKQDEKNNSQHISPLCDNLRFAQIWFSNDPITAKKKSFAVVKSHQFDDSRTDEDGCLISDGFQINNDWFEDQ